MLAVEKLLPSKMLLASSNRKIFHVDDHVGVVRHPPRARSRVSMRTPDTCHANACACALLSRLLLAGPLTRGSS